MSNEDIERISFKVSIKSVDIAERDGYIEQYDERGINVINKITLKFEGNDTSQEEDLQPGLHRLIIKVVTRNGKRDIEYEIHMLCRPINRLQTPQNPKESVTAGSLGLTRQPFTIL